MKALSVRQPWPWLMFRPDLTKLSQRLEAEKKGLIKDIENRDWKYPPKYRGQLLIHASKTFDLEGYLWVRENFPWIKIPGHEYGHPQGAENLFNRGGFVGLCRLNDVVKQDNSPWFFGPLGFKLRMAQPIEFIPYSGQLGLFDVPDEIIKKVEVII